MEEETVPHAVTAGNVQYHGCAPVKHLVILAPNWLGDAVMALPAIADVRRASPEVAIDVAARASIAPLFKLAAGPGAVIALGSDRLAWRDPGKDLRDRGFDAALLLPNSFHAAFTVWRARIPERWGYRTDWRGPLLTRAVGAPKGVHQGAYYQHLVEALGFARGPLEPRLDVPPHARRAGAHMLTAQGWDPRAPLVALAPGAASGGAKRWPAKSFAEVATALAKDGAGIVLVGSRADRPAGAALVAALADLVRPINLIGRTDLPTLAGVLVNCRALVSNDSGAMHFGAALGVSVTAVFGPTDERATRPLGTAEPVVLTHPVWCRPCMLPECPIDHRCMRRVKVEAVLGAVRRTL